MEEEKRPLFVNVSTPTQEQYTQAFRKVIVGPVFLIVVPVFLVLDLLLIFVPRLASGAPLVDGENFPLLVILLAVLGLFFLVWFWLPARSAKLTVRQMQEGYQRPATMRTVIDEEGVTVRNEASGGELRFTYDTFSAFLQTQDALLLKTKSKQFVILLKKGFEEGSVEALKAFMENHCPTAKAKWRK